MKFRKSEVFRDKFEREFKEIKDKILKVLDYVEVLPIGGIVIPGALTKGDLDVQVRVRRNKFSNAIKALSVVFEVYNQNLWNNDLAIFNDTSYTPKADILVTVIGSEEDELQEIQKLLKRDKNLLNKYNKLKMRFEDGEMEEYRIAKREFYNKLRKFLKSG